MSEIIVQVEQGQLRGKTGTDVAGKTYYSFQGIPFAKPPLRFKDSEPVEPWEGIRDATKEGSVCYERDMLTGVLVGSEDCLFLNVYTPQAGNIDKETDNSLRPVMFWVHGGSFVTGSGNTDVYGPEFLVTHDVVVVTTNYRLGLFGFLKFEDQSLDVPGNQGFKDMVLALRWVKSNIHNFNGDTNNITIFGESAGSASINFLLLSPLARGLYHKAIMESGCVFNVRPNDYKQTQRFADALNLDTTDEKEILEALKALPMEKILETQEKLAAGSLDGESVPYGPSIGDTFLPEDPKDIMQSGNYTKVPLLIGYTDAEGLLSVRYWIKSGREPVHKNFEPLVPFTFNLKLGSEECKRVAQQIKEFYYKDQEPTIDDLQTFVQLESDTRFLHGVQKTMENRLKHSQEPVFFYRFSFDGKVYLLPRLMDIPFKAAGHADELTYLFKRPTGPDFEPGSSIDLTLKRMTRLWTNFAKYGDPNPKEADELLNVEWKPIAEGALNYLEIDEELSAGVNPEAERIAFWDRLYEDFPYAKYW